LGALDDLHEATATRPTAAKQAALARERDVDDVVGGGVVIIGLMSRSTNRATRLDDNLSTTPP
jgi:hypothetical protein